MPSHPDAKGPAATKSQNGAMSDDPGDGKRTTSTLTGEGGGPPGEQPGEQGSDQLAEFGRRGSKQG